jgi:hypothetical protein
VYFKIISVTEIVVKGEVQDVSVFNMLVPFGDWLWAALPYAALLIAGVIIVFVLNCIVIARTEEV